MKRWEFFTSVLLVLLAFSAGVGLNFFPVNTTVQGSPEDPPIPLKFVTHDATLTGSGTTAAPLGVANRGVGMEQLANGAVTAPKISAAGLPAVGQVLSFNGTSLAWQTPSEGAVRVIDRNGHVVGPLIAFDGVPRQVGAFTFLLRVDASGYRTFTLIFYHTTSDCSGPRYFFEDGKGFWRNSTSAGTQLFYAADPLQQITIKSSEQINFPDRVDPNQPGPCSAFTQTITAGLATSLDLSTLGFFPPFSLRY